MTPPLTSPSHRARWRYLFLLPVLAILAAYGAMPGPPREPPRPEPAPPRTQETAEAFIPLPRSESVHFPRDVDAGPGGMLYIVDRTATVHKMAPDGRLLASFPMPEGKRGNPQGLTVAPGDRSTRGR